MKKTLFLAILALLSSPALAIEIDLFRQEDGHTNWQHLANYTGSTLLILLTIVSVYLFIARRNAHQANLELTSIRNELEVRVEERTATLHQANQLLKEEVSQHVITSNQLQSSESYIKDILTSMPLMLVGLDKNGCITQWNKQVEKIAEISSDDALGKKLWEVYPKITVQPEHVQQAIDEKKIIHLKQSMRSLYHFDITIYPLQESEAGVVILIDDVTKQTTAENMLIHNDKMSFMSELASTMAHDINLPLQAIMMDLRRFQRIISGQDIIESQQSNDTDQAEVLNEIITDMSAKGEQVSTIISNLLTFSRSRNSEKQMADIAELMENTISLANEVITVSADLPFNQIKLEKSIEKNLPLVPCYVTELQQVFLSLFRHAAKALVLKKQKESFEPQIKIILSESYGNLWIKVQHNGLGLTADEQMNLFEPFFTDKSTAEDYDAGQRLSFSYYIVTEQHQGNMAVTSDVELGSTIHIQLPIRH
ncbi:MAG: PAS domain-containing sensor histidine kinase [Gammaproteobacteria bacterium]|nr:MAG: PAS domain-containing sensor histidine kinase [Gammaproteobacteria bacterium]